MKFLIQTINNEIKHDFSFILLESIEYHNWLNSDNITYQLTDDILLPDYTPIGSVEFVTRYLKQFHDIEVKPINIPSELLDFKYTNRYVINGTEKDISSEKFVKSNDKIKSFTEICSSAPKGNYQISDLIDIESEWRVFIYNNKMVGLQNYSGCFKIFPDIKLIEEMIEQYESKPVAFTLDVGINKDKTFIIEIHDFFSCGLYGFSDHRILPFMFNRWFKNKINENKKK